MRSPFKCPVAVNITCSLSSWIFEFADVIGEWNSSQRVNERIQSWWRWSLWILSRSHDFHSRKFALASSWILMSKPSRLCSVRWRDVCDLNGWGSRFLVSRVWFQHATGRNTHTHTAWCFMIKRKSLAKCSVVPLYYSDLPWYTWYLKLF